MRIDLLCANVEKVHKDFDLSGYFRKCFFVILQFMAIAEDKIVSLSRVNEYIGQILSKNIGGKRFWLRTEIASVNFPSSGHAYLELVENEHGTVLARAGASIWRNALEEIKHSLGTEYENVLKKGSEILCVAEVTYHRVYGIKLLIHEVDLSFSLGELERKRQETIDLLTKEGLIGKNKEHVLPEVVKKVIVIGAHDSAGYGDFEKQLNANQYGYSFEIELLTTLVQGAAAEGQIVRRLHEALKIKADAIVLIRGGGSKLDLDLFNSYAIAKAIALHPLPVITGIGHEQDISVADLVAHTMLKTPSAVGAYLVERTATYEGRIREIYSRIHARFNLLLSSRNHKLEVNSNRLINKALAYTRERSGDMKYNAQGIIRATQRLLQAENSLLKDGMQTVKSAAINLIRPKQNELQYAAQRMKGQVRTIIQEEEHEIRMKKLRIKQSWHTYLSNKKQGLVNLEVLIESVRPENTLKRGFGIIQFENKLVKARTKLEDGDILEVKIHKKKFYVEYKGTEEKWLKKHQ
jgi:exodeoxyribonuclease VII large subunit